MLNFFATELLPFFPHLIFAGVLAGLLAGLFGIGGGLIVVPTLFTLLQFKGLTPATAMAMALATSLASIIPTSISSMRAHHVLNNIRWDIVRIWAPTLILGVLVGSSLIAKLRSRYFILYFAVFLAVVALYSLRQHGVTTRPLPRILWQRLSAFGLGLLSVIAGVGGGSLGVPLLKTLGTTPHQAVGTCAVFGLLVALPGALSLGLFSTTPAEAPPGSWGLIYLPALVIISPLTILCAPIGAWLGHKIPAGLLMRLFAGFLFLVAARMFWVGFTG